MEIHRYERLLDIRHVEHHYAGTERIYLAAKGERLSLNAVDLTIKQILVNGKWVGRRCKADSYRLFLLLRGFTSSGPVKYSIVSL